MAFPSESARRALVTGIAGFTGVHLARALRAAGFEVHGTVHEPLSGDDPTLHRVDLLDAAALREVVSRVRPTHVVHLAAISFVAHGDVDEMYRTNIVATRHLLHALADLGGVSSVLLASSANIYGNAPVSPIGEDTPPAPANDYAVSKLAMEHMARLWAPRLPLTIARPFNYTGIGQAPHFLIPKIVAAFRERAARLELGNLDVERDFGDVRDVAQAYLGLLEQAPGGVFNISTGRALSLREVLAEAERLTGHRPEVVVNPAFVRANEVHRLCGDNARLRQRLPHWQPRPFVQTLRWMLGLENGAA